MRLLLFVLSLMLCSAVVAAPPPLMLATEYRDGVPVGDYRVSEKLDGVRGYWDGRALWTRGGHRVNAPAWFVAGWPDVAMDGELWMGRGRFEADSEEALKRIQDDFRAQLLAIDPELKLPF